ncbi:hypothetical protein BMMON2_32340 [Burkholderia mallei]
MRGLRGARVRIDLDALVGAHLRAERVDALAVDEHPAFLDPFVCFAARAETQLRHALRQAHEAGFVAALDTLAAFAVLTAASGFAQFAAAALDRLRELEARTRRRAGRGAALAGCARAGGRPFAEAAGRSVRSVRSVRGDVRFPAAP